MMDNLSATEDNDWHLLGRGAAQISTPAVPKPMTDSGQNSATKGIAYPKPFRHISVISDNNITALRQHAKKTENSENLVQRLTSQ